MREVLPICDDMPGDENMVLMQGKYWNACEPKPTWSTSAPNACQRVRVFFGSGDDFISRC